MYVLRAHIKGVTTNHVCRTGNVAAHLMARNAKLVSDYVVWVEDTPPIIQSQVIRDVLYLNLSSV